MVHPALQPSSQPEHNEDPQDTESLGVISSDLSPFDGILREEEQREGQRWRKRCTLEDASNHIRRQSYIANGLAGLFRRYLKVEDDWGKLIDTFTRKAAAV